MIPKPEHMTHLHGDTLVSKNHPRIHFRGKLDSLGAQVVLIQCEVAVDPALVANLQEIRDVVHELMRCEVLDRPFARDTILGLSFAELREQSHNPQKYFGLRAMIAPDAGQGRTNALLNALRTAVRETELAAVAAFEAERPDLTQALNRLSSGVYILMCRARCSQRPGP